MSSSEWNKAKLDDACLNITDGSHTSPPSVEKGYFMASVKDMGEYGFNFENCRMISEDDYLKLVKSGCQPHYGDVLIGKDGARYLEDAFVFKQDEKVVLLSSIAILRPEKTKIIPEFLYYFLTNKNTRIDIKNNYGSGSAIPRMVLKDFKRVPIPIPPIAEQKAITDTLSCLDDKIELNNRINKTLEEMARAIFKSWFVDFEPFQGGEFEDSELGRIPKGWKVVELGEICNCVLGGTPSRQIEGYWNGHIPWINSGKVNDYRITEASEYITELGLRKSATTLLPAKTVVLAITGATLGQVSILEILSCANQSVVGILEKDSIPYEFIYPMICSHIHGIINNQTGGAQQHINKGNVEKEKIIIPGSKVMSDYKITVKSLYDAIAKNCFENKKLKEIRDSLLPKLMNGEIRVPVEKVQ